MTPSPDGTAALRTMARGGAFAAAGSAAGAALGLVLTLVVTHGLPQTTAGEFFGSTAVFLVLQTLLAFGVGAGLVRFVPRFRALDRTPDVPTLLTVAVVPVVAAGVVGSVALWLLSGTISSAVADGAPHPVAVGLDVMAALFLPATLEIAAVECTRAFGRLRSYVLLQQLGVPLLRPVLVGLAVAANLPLWAVILAWLVPLVVALLASAAIVRRALRALLGAGWRTVERTTTVRAIAREYWGFTLARGTASVMDILLTWLDVVLVASLVSAADAAVYAAASRFVTAGTLVLQALRLTLATDISAALARHDTDRVSEMYRAATSWVVLTSWPVYLLMAVFAPTVLRVFGASYASGATALSVLCGAMMVYLAAGNVGTVLLMGGKGGWVLADKTLCVIVNVGLDLLLIPHIGIVGAAIGWAAAILVDSGLAFAQVRWGMRIGGRLDGVGLAAGITLIGFGALALAVRVTAGSSLLALVSCVVAGVLVCALPIVRYRHALSLNALSAVVRSR